ncbi:acyl carrier protein [Paenibacillus algorifonticola]|uniref:Acyl carrier protein n=1 Tax=Paenibacillus algorifonticola TaxID=684063 RepID=A0A1I1YTH9_9BACL|nr:phosphopantetheine-binding protein [Paenibacillus algorifonticola]SFE22642.1 acyl carrier protein [Paenibacillus algorifonticola]
MENVQLSIENQIKNMIVTKFGLDISPEEINDDDPLFDVNEQGEGLDLDSVDALELAVGLKELFGVKPQSSDMSVFKSVRSIADIIRSTIGD